MFHKTTYSYSTLIPGFLFVLILAAVAFLRVWSVQDVIWDDNAWLLSIYESNGLEDFLQVGFNEMRRTQLGIFLYALFWFHRYTDSFYVVWHVINTITALGSPLILYFFLKRMFPRQQELALFSAVALVVFHLDLTLPFASASNYRLGFLTSLLSFFFLERAVHGQKTISIGWYIISLCCAILSHSLFIEATVALEPARGLALLYMLRSAQEVVDRGIWRRTFYAWIPFVLTTLPIVLYKLIYKPYGLFGRMYNLNPFFFTEWHSMLSSLAYYLLFYWFVLLNHLDAVTPTSWGLGLMVATISYFVFFKKVGNPLLEEIRTSSQVHSPAGLLLESIRSSKAFLLFGAVAFIPAFLFFQLINRPVSWDFDSSHAVVPQFGYAMLTGWLLALAYRFSVLRNRRDPWMKYVFSAIFGAGIFVANANIDQYLKTWEMQNRFWEAFIKRFPSLPEESYFIFDIQKSSLYTDMDNPYNLEFQLNLLYANSAEQVPFRRRHAEDIRIWYQSIGSSPRPLKNLDPSRIELAIKQKSHFGDEIVKTKISNMVFVLYWNGELLVNKEIVERYPSILYRDWADLPLPSLSAHPPTYPLRHKLRSPG